MTDESSETSADPARVPPTSDHTVWVQQLFVKNQSRLKAFVLSLQPDFAEAEDILQEVFLVVTRKAEQFIPDTNFMAWALRICRLKVLESFRHKKTSCRPLSEEVVEALCHMDTEDFFQESRLRAVQLCLDKLAPNLKEILQLRYFAEHGPTEIARRKSWTPNSVNVALTRARKLMQECVNRKVREA